MSKNVKGKCIYCGKPIRYRDEYCAFCGKENAGWKETTRKQCGNCHAYLSPEDKYCRLCGTKVGKGAYDPYQDLMQCIYGPEPVEREHQCRRCGYKWKTCAMVDNEKYCPKCGGRAPYRKE